MRIEVSWGENNILNIEKREEYFYTILNLDELELARKKGFPLFFVKDIKVVSKELPYFVKRRIYNLNCNRNNDEEIITIIENELRNRKRVGKVVSPIDKIRIKIEM